MLPAVGGGENVASAANCMTRLRLNLRDAKKANIDELKKIPGVVGVNDTPSEFQIIFNPPGKAAGVCAALNEILPKGNERRDAGAGRALPAANALASSKVLLKRIATIFLPLIPGFIGCGFLTGTLAILAKIDPSITAAPLWQLLATAGNTVFWGLNLFVGVNAAKEFGGTPIIGGVLGAFISHPGLSNITLAGINFAPGRGGVIAVILAAVFAAWLEKKIRLIVPSVFDLFLTPFLTILSAVLATAFVLQPVGGFVSDAIGKTVLGAIENGGMFTGFVLAGLWLPVVMTGMHQGMTPIHVDLLAQFGVTVLLPILAMAGAGQVGAALAVYFKSKNKKLKKTVLSALPVGLMGVGEPLIYGVTLPLGKPFGAACLGGAIGGAVVAHFAVGARAMGISGLPLAPTVDNIGGYLAGLVTAYVAGFAAAYLIGFNDPQEE